MASEREYSAEEMARFEEEVARLREEELARMKEEEVKSAAQRAVAREMELERELYHEELETVVEETAVETPAEARREAMRTVPSQLLTLLALLFLLAFLISVFYPNMLRSLFGFGGTADAKQQNNAPAQFERQLSQNNAGNNAGGALTTSARPSGPGLPGDMNAGGVDGLNSVVGLGGATVDPLFWSTFSKQGGVTTCGLPLAPIMAAPPNRSDARRIQWFERCRLEHWPEYRGTPNEFQRGLLGSEYTDHRDFPDQQFFASRPGLNFFAETSQAVGEPFLSFWEAHGGLAVFGYPISEVLQEELEDGNIHNVQYFQRVRMEEHLETPESPVMLGLLGRALYLQEAKPRIIPPLQPTPVPLP